MEGAVAESEPAPIKQHLPEQPTQQPLLHENEITKPTADPTGDQNNTAMETGAAVPSAGGAPITGTNDPTVGTGPSTLSGGSTAVVTPAQSAAPALINGVAPTAPAAPAAPAPAAAESPSKSRRKQELVVRQAPANAEIVADAVADARASAAALAAIQAAKIALAAARPSPDDVKAHRRKQQTPKRKLTASPTRLIARHKKVKLGGPVAQKGRRKLKVVTKPPSAGAAGPADPKLVSASEWGDTNAMAVREDIDELESVGGDDVNMSEGGAERGVQGVGKDGVSSASAVDATVKGADTTAPAVDSSGAGPSGAAGVSSPAKRGRPRKVPITEPAEASGSGTATGAPPAADARTKPRPGARRRRRRRPASGFVTRRPLTKRRPVVPKRTTGVVNGHGAAPRVPRKRRKRGDLTIDMKEPFGTPSGKTRSRTRSVTEEDPAGSAPVGRTSRERPVNGAGPSAETEHSPVALDGAGTTPPAAPEGVSAADWEAKWRCWNDDGSKKSWQATDGSSGPSAAPSGPASTASGPASAAPKTATEAGDITATAAADATAGDGESATVASSIPAKAAPPAAPVRRRRRAAGRRRRRADSPAAEPPGRAGGRGRRGRGRPEPLRGPYLVVGGNSTGGGSGALAVRVVNCQGDREGASTGRRPPITCDLDSAAGQPRVGFSSAYAKNYDAFAVDPTWTCVFCRRRSHANGLGDLLGPCFVARRLEAIETAGRPLAGRQRRRSKRDVQEDTNDSTPSTAAPAPTPTSSTPIEFEVARLGDRLETWFHESCLAWSPQLTLSAGKIQGIEDAITASRAELCSVCGVVGATVGCLGRGCRRGFHVPCAAEAGCRLDEESFSSYCNRHQKQ
ncbi:nucleolar protein dao-5-like isoform X1 [Amphibalanus amphitrite]|uniref:nucleolar protein dao-5-like isoform X1 n=2 Tax=Amphibalanus amphitrite TaxID=1232801 RepID=UPI001C9186BE|nr:nucleolar protein dao-5-like isoform X1 [Amphibalanus amphitrite]